MINSTHLVMFQEVSPGSEYQSAERSVPKTLTHFKSSQEQQIHDVRVNPKKRARKTHGVGRCSSYISHFDLRYFLWKLLWQVSAGKQTISSFSGWKLLIRKAADVVVQTTVMTYLLPINALVTDFSTIFGYLSYMQKLCKEVNMPYVNVTLDLGAAMNAYKLVWNYLNLLAIFLSILEIFIS